MDYTTRTLERRVTCLEVFELEDEGVVSLTNVEELQMGQDIPFVTFPVWHGAGYKSFGYAFGMGMAPPSTHNNEEGKEGTDTKEDNHDMKKDLIVYISDLSDISADIMAFLESFVVSGRARDYVDNLHATRKS